TLPYQPSPKTRSGRPAHRPFRGLLGVHSRCGLHTRAVTVFRDTLSEGFSHFVTSIAAPVASGWSVRRVGFAPTGKRRLVTAHGLSGRYDSNSFLRHAAGAAGGDCLALGDERPRAQGYRAHRIIPTIGTADLEQQDGFSVTTKSDNRSWIKRPVHRRARGGSAVCRYRVGQRDWQHCLLSTNLPRTMGTDILDLFPCRDRRLLPELRCLFRSLNACLAN